jgi:preprotein translocase subunit SecG
MDLSGFAPYFSVAEIVIGVALVVLVLLQTKGSDLGGFMGGDTSTGYRTKRGMDATMHNVTIGFSIAFFVCTILTFVSLGQAG